MASPTSATAGDSCTLLAEEPSPTASASGHSVGINDEIASTPCDSMRECDLGVEGASAGVEKAAAAADDCDASVIGAVVVDASTLSTRFEHGDAIEETCAAVGCGYDTAVPPTAPTAVASEPTLPTRFGPGTQVCRMRFFNFNMGNNSQFSLDQMLGPNGRGAFEDIFVRALDGSLGEVDLCFCTLSETRVSLTEFARRRPWLKLIGHNAYLEEQKQQSYLRGLAGKIAKDWNGNLKTLLSYREDCLKEASDAILHGNFVEMSIGGVAVPNPKKAFVGNSLLLDHTSPPLRLWFVGAHFPVQRLASVMAMSRKNDAAFQEKLVMARTLRDILVNAAQQGALDQQSILFVQGDLNSRTIMAGSFVLDTLVELLADDRMQRAMLDALPNVPNGRWHEIVPSSTAEWLPITYKYQDTIGHSFCLDPTLRAPTIGDLIDVAATNSHQECTPQNSRKSRYDQIYALVGEEQLRSWGLRIPQVGTLKPYQFPACTDRVIYWCPDEIFRRISWSAPAGYVVSNFEGGSDHRPVTLEAVLRVAPPGTDIPVPRYRSSGLVAGPALVRAICCGISEADDAALAAWTERLADQE